MWANTCPLVDARIIYTRPALPQTSADVFQGCSVGGRRRGALRVSTRVHCRYTIIGVILCAQTTSARPYCLLIIFRWWYDRTTAVMTYNIIILYSAEPCAAQCELDDARESRCYYYCRRRTFVGRNALCTRTPPPTR